MAEARLAGPRWSRRAVSRSMRYAWCIGTNEEND